MVQQRKNVLFLKFHYYIFVIIAFTFCYSTFYAPLDSGFAPKMITARVVCAILPTPLSTLHYKKYLFYKI